MKRKYIIEAVLKDEETDEVLCKISGYDMESFEEELYKIESTLKRYKEMEENKCQFCDEPAVEKVKLRIVESPKDEVGILEDTPLCQEHLEDYKNQVGIFEPYVEY